MKGVENCGSERRRYKLLIESPMSQKEYGFNFFQNSLYKDVEDVRFVVLVQLLKSSLTSSSLSRIDTFSLSSFPPEGPPPP